MGELRRAFQRYAVCDAAEKDGVSVRPFEDGVEQLGAALF